jgi:flagellar protein FlaI
MEKAYQKRLKFDLSSFWKMKPYKTTKKINNASHTNSIAENETILEQYPLGRFVSAVITRSRETEETRYNAVYEPLSPDENEVYQKAVKIYREEATFEGGDTIKFFEQEFRRVARKYGLVPSEQTWEKMRYYAGRDLLKTGYGVLDAFMRDPSIEDIRCNGVGIPIFVWHIRYKYIITNIIFLNEDELDNFVRRLAQMAGKHISVAYPRVVALLPGNHRLSANYSREISRFGSVFQIRKFKETALSIVDLIDRGTLSPRMAAYFWILMENRVPFAVIGATGAGKTTTLNALLSMLKPGTGIITVEESPELNLSHLNWISKYVRESYGLAEEVGYIGMFDLVQDALKQRPEVIVIGEVTGKEATVLFQAIATGHGGLCTLHAESVYGAIRRLVAPDIGVSPQDIERMRVYVNLQQVELTEAKDYSTRRVLEVIEVESYRNDKLSAQTIFKWHIRDDSFEEHLERSYILRQIAEASGKTMEELMAEIERRTAFLQHLREKELRSYADVAKAINLYWEGKI